MTTKVSRASRLLAILVLTVAPGSTRATELNARDEVRVITCDAEGREHSPHRPGGPSSTGRSTSARLHSRPGGGTFDGRARPRLAFASHEVPVSAEVVEDPSTLERIHAAFRSKYGGRDVRADFVRFFVGGKITLATMPLENGAAPICGGHAASTDRPQEKG